MQKEFYYSSDPGGDIWEQMWTIRNVEQELSACEMESPPRDLFLSYIPGEGRILDAGCGIGKWVIYLHRLGYDILGIDSNELAVTTLKEYDRTLKIEAGDILDIKYPDCYFDAYISMGVLEHFEDGPQHRGTRCGALRIWGRKASGWHRKRGRIRQDVLGEYPVLGGRSPDFSHYGGMYGRKCLFSCLDRFYYTGGENEPDVYYGPRCDQGCDG